MVEYNVVSMCSVGDNTRAKLEYSSRALKQLLYINMISGRSRFLQFNNQSTLSIYLCSSRLTRSFTAMDSEPNIHQIRNATWFLKRRSVSLYYARGIGEMHSLFQVRSDSSLWRSRCKAANAMGMRHSTQNSTNHLRDEPCRSVTLSWITK